MESTLLKFAISPDIYEHSDELALLCKAFMTCTRGNRDLTPTATQWVLEVKLATNGLTASFDFVENSLRSFTGGAVSLGVVSQYEQVRDGFRATIAPSNLHVFGSQDRGEVQKVQLELNFTFPIGRSEEVLFSSFLSMADEGFKKAFVAFSSIAPLVFDQFTRESFGATSPFLRPLKVALNLDDNTLENALERGLICRTGRSTSFASSRQLCADSGAILVSPKPNMIKRPTVGYGRNGRTSAFFADLQFEHRLFVLLSECDEDEHEIVFAEELTG